MNYVVPHTGGMSTADLEDTIRNIFIGKTDAEA